MAFLQLQFFSESLHMGTAVNVILPEPGGTEELPKVLYLLHSYGDDHSVWMRRTSVERYVAGYNLAVVMPAVGHSFYCNEACGERYWDYVSGELPQALQSFFKLSDKPEDTFAARASMGGYGAMKLALTYPERFGAAGCFSGGVDAAESAHYNAEGRRKKELVFGPLEQIAGSDNDLFYLMEKNRGASEKPRFYVSCGTDDFYYGAYQRFVPALKANGWDVTAFEKADERHSWSFWDEEIAKFIRFIVHGEDRRS